MLLILVLLAMLDNTACTDEVKGIETCHLQNNVTLTCNYIPKTIPEGVLSVIVNLELDSNLYVLKNSNFDSSWAPVKHFELYERFNKQIELQDLCFQGLIGLEELRLHVFGSLNIAPEAFVGIKHMKTLDMRSCVRANFSEIKEALNGSGKLPELSTLILSNFSVLTGPIDFDSQFIEILKLREIDYIDLSSSQFNKLAFKALFKRLNHLETFNISNTNIGDFEDLDLEQDDLKHLKTFDASYSVLPKSMIFYPPGNNKITNIKSNFSEIPKLENLILLMTPENLNLSGLINTKLSFVIENVSLVLDENPSFLTKTLTARENNLKRLDLRLECPRYHILSIQNVDLSSNGLDFLHPGLLSCTPNLKKIDLSKNALFNMAKKDSHLFKNLFDGLTTLEIINLSRNELEEIPPKMFENCRNVKIIDLANNRLQQVHFSLKKLHKLQLLYLTGNNIHILDSGSITNLNDIRNVNKKESGHATVIFGSNPFYCSTCTSMSSIKWLLTTNLVNISSQSLTCITEDKTWEIINVEILNRVKNLCARKTIILIATISAGVLLVLLLIVIFYLKRRKHNKHKSDQRTNAISLLREGKGVYEFAVFLSFSSDDEDFVNSYVLKLLNKTLQLMTNIERNLVCTGDRHFRPGFYVHGESFRCLDAASVMVVVVSNSFCLSEYCLNEVEQAHVKRKPIVLMLIEHVDDGVMSPTVKELYQNNARVIWADENGERVLKTTWKHICTSILDQIE